MFSPSPATPFQHQYHSTHKRAQIVRLLLIIGAALNGLSVFFFVLHFLAPDTIITDDTTDATTIILALMEGGIALMGIGVFIATVIFFSMWMYRSYENLPAFGVSRGSIAYSSGWAVGSFFVPIILLLVPYRATKELWNKSVPNTGTMFSALSPPAFFPIWWTFWILSLIAGNVYTRLAWSGELSPEADALLAAVSTLLSIVAALWAMKVVREIDKQQTESAKLIGQGPVSSGPPPPEMFRNPTVQSQTGA